MSDALADQLDQTDHHADICRMRVRLLATTDLHMHILPYDYLTDLPTGRWGLSQTARLIQQARMEERNCLLLDAGDFLHGTEMGDFVVDSAHSAVGATAGDGPVHPMIAAMNHLRYDAATLGNHDFDRGVDVLLSAIEQADFPIVSANTVFEKGDQPIHDSTFVPPYAIINRAFKNSDGDEQLVRIGVIGFLPPNSIHAGADQALAPQTRDIINAAKSYVPRLRAKGVDLVVAVAHTGIGDATHAEGMENAIVPLCAIDGIDAVIGGHSHQIFPRPENGPPPSEHPWFDQAEVDASRGLVNGVPVVIPGFWGSHLGVIDLDLEEHPDGWAVAPPSRAAPASSLREVSNEDSQAIDPVTPEFSELLGQLHESTLMHVRTRVGYVHQSLNSYFALIGADQSTRLVQQAMATFTQQLIDAGAAPNLPVLASSAAFKCGGLGGPGYYTTIHPGELTLRSVADLYMFPNELALVRANGAYLRAWLERAVSVFNQVEPGKRCQALKDASTPGYLLESVFGLNYRIDLSQPAQFTPTGRLQNEQAGRIADLTYAGKPVQDHDEFLLATSDFRIRGGGGFPTINPERIVPVKPMSIRDLVRHYIQDVERVELVEKPQWSFVPVDGASVQFPSAPNAAACLNEASWLNIRAMDEKDSHGFAQFELML